MNADDDEVDDARDLSLPEDPLLDEDDDAPDEHRKGGTIPFDGSALASSPEIGILVPRPVLEDHFLHLGWPHTSDAERAPALPAVDELLERLVDSGLPGYAEPGEPLFDPVDALNLHRTLARNGGDLIWFAFLERLRAEVGGVDETEGATAHPWQIGPTSFSAPADIECSLARTRYRSAHEAPVRIAIPVPESHLSQPGAAVTITGASHPILEQREERGSIIVTLAGGTSDEVSVECRYRLRSELTELSVEDAQAAPHEPPRDAAESTDSLFGAPTEYLRSVAQNAATGASGEAEIIVKLFQFCFRWLSAGEVYVAALDKEDPLRDLVTKGWFSPLTGSALLAGLAQSLGIPARVTHGLHLVPSYPRWTAWTELWLPTAGWIPCDLFSSWELASGDIQSTVWASRMFGRLDRRLRVKGIPALAPADSDDPRTPIIVYHSDSAATLATHYLPGGQPLGRDRITVSAPVPVQESEGLTQRLFGFLRRG